MKHRIHRIEVYITIILGLFCAPLTAAHAATGDNARTSLKSLDLTRTPSDDELIAAGQLGGVLSPTHAMRQGKRKEAINLSFGEAIEKWNRHEYQEAVSLFKSHVKSYPDSPWAAEAKLHVGCDATYNGRYDEAEENFQAIVSSLKDSPEEGARTLVHKAKARLGVLMISEGDLDKASDYFTELHAESSDWRDRTYASNWIRELSLMKRQKQALLNCGAVALSEVLKKAGKPDAAQAVAGMLPPSMKGFSVEDLQALAGKYGCPLTALRVDAAAFDYLPLPVIAQVESETTGGSGHYWVVEKMDDDVLQIYDPQSRYRFTQKKEEFLRQWNGVALAFTDKTDLPGVRLTLEETRSLYGGCCGVKRPTNDLGKPTAPGNNAPSLGGNGCGSGAPVWRVNMINMNFFMTDTPLWYENTIGPSVAITLSYNSQSAIAEHEPFGNKWQFNYGSYLVVDTAGSVTVFMPDGRRDVYASDGSGGYTSPLQVHNTLTKIAENHFELKFPDDTVYAYNIPTGTTSLQPFLVEIRDVHGRKLSFGYNSAVELTTITDAANRKTTLAYTSAGFVSKVSDPFGRSASFEYDAGGNLTKITDMGGYWTSFTYDSDVYPASLTNASGTWGFYFEPADGVNNGSNHYPAPGGTMWEDYRITVTNPLGGKEEYEYDGYSSYGWYVNPNDYIPYSSSSKNNYASGVPKIRYDYTTVQGKGQVYKITSPGGGAVQYTFDSTTGDRLTVRDANGHTTTYTYNGMGMPTSVKEPSGHTTSITYASDGVSVTGVDNGLGTEQFTYNAYHEVTSVTDRLGAVTAFTYNSYGHIVTATDALNNTTTFTYDSSQRLTKVASGSNTLATFGYDSIGRVASRTDATGLTLGFSYNNLNNVTQVSYPDGKSENFTFSGCCPYLVDAVSDRAGRVTSYTHNALKRLTESENPEGGAVRFGYDGNMNVTSLTDPNGNATSFAYDSQNRLVAQTDAAGNSVAFAYDPAGLLTSKTNARGGKASYTYDVNDNLTQVSYSDGTPSVQFTYDAYNRPSQIQDAIGSTSLTYNAGSHVTAFNGPFANIGASYDVLGRRVGMTPQGGDALAYSYDSLGRLNEVKIGGNRSYTYTYNGASPLVSYLTRPNGSVTSYSYDSLKRLTGLSNETSASAVINSYAYTYDERDVRTSETITNGLAITEAQSSLTTYDYNELNQLLRSVSPEKLYTYDADGNLTKGYTPAGYAFTAAYDAENRMKSLSYSDASNNTYLTAYSYGWDSFLSKVQKYKNSVLVSETRYVREGLLPVQERDGNNAVIRQYAFGLNVGGGIGGLLNLKQSSEDYSYTYDGNGNIVAILDSFQVVKADYAYEPFGILKISSGILEQPFKFSTKLYDSDTGLSYFGYRYYAPILGKWTTTDPIGYSSMGFNLYEYVQNNPTDLIDPLGLLAFHHYGNFGGPGWSGGRYVSEDKMTLQDMNVAAIDSLDKCYKNHDICIYMCYNNNSCSSGLTRGVCVALCDFKLSNCEMNIARNPYVFIMENTLNNILVGKNPNFTNISRLIILPYESWLFRIPIPIYHISNS